MPTSCVSFAQWGSSPQLLPSLSSSGLPTVSPPEENRVGHRGCIALAFVGGTNSQVLKQHYLAQWVQFQTARDNPTGAVQAHRAPVWLVAAGSGDPPSSCPTHQAAALTQPLCVTTSAVTPAVAFEAGHPPVPFPRGKAAGE